MTKAMKAGMQRKIDALLDAVDDEIKAAAGVLRSEGLADRLRELKAAQSTDNVGWLRDVVETTVSVACGLLTEADRTLVEVQCMLTEATEIAEGEEATA